MISAINIKDEKNTFCAKPQNDKVEDETRLLPDTIATRVKQSYQKTESAFIDYPIRGLKGDKNSNFYEFLAMGIIPYLTGSLTLMAVFNCVNKHLTENSRVNAKKVGNKMALGVLFYGIFKSLAKNLVTIPVNIATGVNTEMPYQNKVYALPKEAGEDANIDIQYQQRTVFDSNEFYRKDLLTQEYFDNVAKKVGLGENLNDSKSEVGPIVQNIVATSNLAKNISKYLWAATGVAIAVQQPWEQYFTNVSKIFKYKRCSNEANAKFFKKALNFCKDKGLKIWDFTIFTGKTFGQACKTLWKGNSDSTKLAKHSGKGLIGLAALTTIGLTLNTIIKAKQMAKKQNKNVIDKNKTSMEI